VVKIVGERRGVKGREHMQAYFEQNFSYMEEGLYFLTMATALGFLIQQNLESWVLCGSARFLR
jgi:hypothetical protein